MRPRGRRSGSVVARFLMALLLELVGTAPGSSFAIAAGPTGAVHATPTFKPGMDANHCICQTGFVRGKPRV